MEGSLGDEPVTISIEVKAEKRRMGAPWVESMLRKHERRPTDKLVLVWPLDPGDPDRPGTPDDLGGPSAPGAAGDADLNHRLSVLSSFFSFLIERDTRAGSGRWRGQMNPVPASGGGMGTHGSPGRDAPRRGRRGELCLRSQRRLPRAIDAAL